MKSRGDWIQTYTGKRFHPLDPQPEDIDINDIAHALALTCRFNGHCLRFYSVAEHSVIVSRYVPKHLALTALLHDASEAYITDVPRPVKPMISGYKDLELFLEEAIAKKFGLPFPLPPEVKAVDNSILADEMGLLMGPPPAPWTFYGEPLGLKVIAAMPPAEAEIAFLERYHELTND